MNCSIFPWIEVWYASGPAPQKGRTQRHQPRRHDPPAL